MLPRSPQIATLIEFSHRLTSGFALIAVGALLVWTFRTCRAGHPARLAAVLSMFFILTEAAIGAGLVLFELVADNATMARAMFMAAHLLNTFFLLGALTVTAWSLTTGLGVRLQGRLDAATAIATGCAALLLAGASGAVAALGDTLFPSTSLGEAFAADLSASSHLLLRLRVLHPVLAIAAAVIVVWVVRRLSRGGTAASRHLARAVTAVVALQVGLGFTNVILLAPVWLQLSHLLVADAIWIGFVLVGAEAVAAPAAVRAAAGSLHGQPRDLRVRA